MLRAAQHDKTVERGSLPVFLVILRCSRAPFGFKLSAWEALWLKPCFPHDPSWVIQNLGFWHSDWAPVPSVWCWSVRNIRVNEVIAIFAPFNIKHNRRFGHRPIWGVYPCVRVTTPIQYVQTWTQPQRFVYSAVRSSNPFPQELRPCFPRDLCCCNRSNIK